MAIVDWARAEHLYRRGELSVREIARRVGVSEGAVRKRVKALGWERKGATSVRVPEIPISRALFDLFDFIYFPRSGVVMAASDQTVAPARCNT